MGHMRVFIASLLLSLACGTSAPPANWRIDITTEGGFTGRGLGNATVTPESVANCDHAALDRALAAAKPAEWREAYREPGKPNGHPDQILTTMSVTIDGATKKTSWYSREIVPKDALALFDAAWALRACGR